MSDEGRSISGPERVALITGTSNGIGRATASTLLAKGVRVVGLDTKAPDPVEANGSFVPVLGDVRSSDDCRAAVQAAVTEFGRLDYVFCNAGVFHSGSVEQQTEEEWDHQIDTLLKGTFFTCKYAIPALRESGGGSIVLSGSNCSHVGCAGRFGYTAAKAAMPVLAKQLSNDYFHSAHIRTNCISPGFVESEMTRAQWRVSANASPDSEVPEIVTAKWQRPEAIAGVVQFLFSDEAADITGVTVPVSRTALLRVAGMRQ